MVKLVVASLLIPIGFLFALAIATEYTNPQGTDQEKASAVTAGILIGLPALVIGTGLTWQEYIQFSRKLAAKKRRINAIFTYLLVQNHGIISLTSFMQKLHLSSQDAQRFLERQLTLYPGSYKRYQKGNIYYYFNQQTVENQK